MLCDGNKSARSIHVWREDLGTSGGVDDASFDCGVRGTMVVVSPRYEFEWEESFEEREG